MNKDDCQNEKFSARAVGTIAIVVSLLLLTVGLIVLPVVGFVFGLPILIFGLALIFKPESKVCRLIMDGVQSK